MIYAVRRMQMGAWAGWLLMRENGAITEIYGARKGR